MAGFGFTNWDERVVPGGQYDNSDRFPFIKLKDGNNVLRFITPPAKYNFVKFPDGSKWGQSLRTAYPGVSREEDPAISRGLPPKFKYFIGALTRGDEPMVGIFDMSTLIYEQLQALSKDPEVGDPLGCDLNIRYNKAAKSPGSKFTVIPRNSNPLSEADQKVIEAADLEKLKENILRLCAPKTVEQVTEQMKKFGWDGQKTFFQDKQEKSNDSEMEESEDYTFKRPA